MRVCKFGGAALRDGEAFQSVRSIVQAEPSRQVIVPSAPGKRDSRDEKITDLLYACQSAASDGRAFSHLFDRIASRYREIAAALGLPAPDEDLRQVYAGLREGASPAWAASRGEWLSGRLLGAYLGFPTLDAAQVIRFDGQGRLDTAETLALLRKTLHGPCVLPGFYGADGTGTVYTLARGGSDVTAALAAAACNADVYENWKDVRGVFSADPDLVPDALYIPRMTYREQRALSLLGGQVLSEDAVAPVRQAGVPLNIRSFLSPGHPGTWIGPAFSGEKRSEAIAVTGQTKLTLYRLERQDGGEDLAQATLKAGLAPYRMAADADALCLTLKKDEALPQALHRLYERAWQQEHAAAVSVIGEGLSRMDGAARFAAALSAAGIGVLSLHMPPEGLYITALIPGDRFAPAINAVYDAFIRR